MKALITETFSGMRILSDAADDEFSRLHSLSELKKCENVLLGSKIEGGCIEAVIDNDFVLIHKAIFKHPYGGAENVFEVL